MDRRQETVPAARTRGLVVTESKNEVLVYDLEAHHIHHLNPLAATVRRLCTGEQTMAGLAIASGLAEESVRIALSQLATANLLDGEVAVPRRAAGSSRRAFLRRSAIAGATAVPAIVSISAPRAAAAQSAGSRFYKCSNQQCDSQTACSLLCAPANACPPGCMKTTQYTCMNFDGPLVPNMCAVYCDCS